MTSRKSAAAIIDERPAAPAGGAYERDFFAWTEEQARLLRQLKPAGLDWENAAEEIESVGRSDKFRIENNLAVILVHLVKWQFPPVAWKPGWRASIREHRRRVLKVVKASPSLRGYPALVLAEEYEAARLTAIDETGLPATAFPVVCPFSIEEVLDPAFWPEPHHG